MHSGSPPSKIRELFFDDLNRCCHAVWRCAGKACPHVVVQTTFNAHTRHGFVTQFKVFAWLRYMQHENAGAMLGSCYDEQTSEIPKDP